MATMVRIDKGTRIPPKWSRGWIYPWGDLGIGDSFFVKEEQHRSLRLLQNAIQHSGRKWLNRMGQRGSRRIATRTVDGGVRAWMLSRTEG